MGSQGTEPWDSRQTEDPVPRPWGRDLPDVCQEQQGGQVAVAQKAEASD